MTDTLTIEQKVLSKSTTGAGTIPIIDIYISPDRQRKDTPAVRKYIDEELAPSFLDNGIIQPPVLHFPTDPIIADNRSYPCELIAGWCRTQTAISLGMENIVYNLRENLRPDELQELELEENLRRLDMTWQDKALGIRKIHKLKAIHASAEGETWGYKQTGKLIGYSSGYVSDVIKVCSAIDAGHEGVLTANSVAEAFRVLIADKEDQVIASLAEASSGVAAPPRQPKSTPSMGPIRGESGISIQEASTAATSSKIEPLNGPAFEEASSIDLTNMLYNMDNRDWFAQQPDESIDLVYTDIPYGIDMDMLDFSRKDLDRVADAHDVEENLEQMKPFLENSYRVLKNQRYLVFWYDLAHHEKLQQWAKDAGFTVQVPPLIWCKEHTCSNRAGNQWWTGATEYAMVCRKGTATLRQAQSKNFFLADGSAERKTQRNPFAKPFAVSKRIIEPLVIAGDTMLDCYAGEGSLVRAALTLGLKVKAVEKDKGHFDRLVEHVRKQYSTMTRGQTSIKGYDDDDSHIIA